MGQKFYASPADKHAYPNGAIAFHSGGVHCFNNGTFAKVRNCPIVCEGLEGLRLTAYATGYADTFFSIPACTRYKGVHIGGYLTNADSGIEFRVYDRFKAKLIALQNKRA